MPARHRILIVHRYFWPDSPVAASVLRHVGAGLVERGYDVDVLTAQPGYNRDEPVRAPRQEMLDGMRVRRLPLLFETKATRLRRAVNVVAFCAQVFFIAATRRRRADVVVALSFPPLVMVPTLRAAAALRRSRLVSVYQDIYPETMQADPLAAPTGVGRLLARFDTRQANAADRVLVLSDDMRSHLVARGVRADHIKICNNFDLIETTLDPERPAEVADGRRYLVFAGNLGRFQGLDTLLERYLASARSHDLDLVFVGEGSARAELEDQARRQRDRVHFLGARPFVETQSLVLGAAAAIVSLKPGVIRLAYPSKAVQALSAGARLLLVVEARSELAELVLGEHLGEVVDPLTDHAFTAALERLAADSEPIDERIGRIRGVASRAFGRTAGVACWCDAITSTLPATTRGHAA